MCVCVEANVSVYSSNWYTPRYLIVVCLSICYFFLLEKRSRFRSNFNAFIAHDIWEIKWMKQKNWKNKYFLFILSFRMFLLEHLIYFIQSFCMRLNMRVYTTSDDVSIFISYFIFRVYFSLSFSASNLCEQRIDFSI